MNLLDLLIIAPLAYFSYRGYVNGIIKEVLSIVGIILAVFLTFEYMEAFGRAIQPLFGSDANYVPFVAGVILFIGIVALVNLAAFLSKKFLEAINLNFVNRLSGLGFGFLKSGIMVSAVLLLLAGFNLPGEQSRENSFAYGYVIYIAPVAFDAVAAIYPGAENFTETLEQTLNEFNPIQNLPIFQDE